MHAKIFNLQENNLLMPYINFSAILKYIIFETVDTI